MRAWGKLSNVLRHFHVLKIKLAPKELHAQQGKNYDKEEEEEEQRGNGADRVEQRGHQVAQRCPIPGKRRDGHVGGERVGKAVGRTRQAQGT